jgi:hypothetical protein
VKIFKHLPRMFGWLIAASVLSLAVLAIAPQQIPVSLYKVDLIAIAGVVGYWLDRALFPYARPDRFLPSYDGQDELCVDPDTLAELPMFDRDHYLYSDLLAAAAMLRRALIVAAAMIAVGLGA